MLETSHGPRVRGTLGRMARSVVIVGLALLCAEHDARAEDRDLGACEERAFVGKDPTPVRVVETTRDRRHRRKREITAVQGGTTFVVDYTYDARGRVAATKLQGGSRTVFEYDSKTGRHVRSVVYPDAKARVPSSTWTLTYDRKGRLVRETSREGTKGPITIDKRYTYDMASRIATVTLDGGHTVETRHYDSDGLLVRSDEITDGTTKVFTYRYDAKHRQIEQAEGTNRIEYVYDCAPPTSGPAAAEKPRRPEPSDSAFDKPGYCGIPGCGGSDLRERKN